jgi:tetratricopeptide (TPR) repeat protein
VSGHLDCREEFVRVVLHLIDAEKGVILENERFEEEAKDRDLIVKRVQELVFEMLHLSLRPDSGSVLAANTSQTTEVYSLYLEGIGYLERYDNLTSLEQAIERFQVIREKDPDYAPAYAALGEAYRHRFIHDSNPDWIVKGEDVSRKAIELDPDSTSAHLSLGLIFRERGRYEEALLEFEDVLEKEPTRAEAWWGKGSALAKLGRDQEAETAYKKAVEVRPRFWANHKELAKYYREHGMYELALETFYKMYGLIPGSYQVHNDLAVAYLDLNRPDQAEVALKSSLQIAENAAAYDLLGTCRYQQKRYSEATEYYQRALELDPSEYFVWGNLAVSHRRNGADQEADRCYHEALKRVEKLVRLDPRNPVYMSDLAAYSIAVGEVEKGLKILSESLQLPSAYSDPWTLCLVGQLYEKLGDRREAIRWVIEALKRGYPKDRVDGSPSLEDLVKDENYLDQLSRLDSEASGKREAKS